MWSVFTSVSVSQGKPCTCNWCRYGKKRPSDQPPHAHEDIANVEWSATRRADVNPLCHPCIFRYHAHMWCSRVLSSLTRPPPAPRQSNGLEERHERALGKKSRGCCFGGGAINKEALPSLMAKREKNGARRTMSRRLCPPSRAHASKATTPTSTRKENMVGEGGTRHRDLFPPLGDVSVTA